MKPACRISGLHAGNYQKRMLCPGGQAAGSKNPQTVAAQRFADLSCVDKKARAYQNHERRRAAARRRGTQTKRHAAACLLVWAECNYRAKKVSHIKGLLTTSKRFYSVQLYYS